MATAFNLRAGSRDVARPMTQADICNVEPVTADEAAAMGVPTAMATLDADTLDALGWGERWTLPADGCGGNSLKAIDEAKRQAAAGNILGACVAARLAIESEVNRLAQPNRRKHWEVGQITCDLREDEAISRATATRIRSRYYRLSEVVHGKPRQLFAIVELIEKTASVVDELRLARPAYRKWAKARRTVTA